MFNGPMSAAEIWIA